MSIKENLLIWRASNPPWHIMHYHVFNKNNTFIPRRYQLHSASATMKCPKDITDAHILLEKEKVKKIKDSATVMKPCSSNTNHR
jgi:hypothetical protein